MKEVYVVRCKPHGKNREDEFVEGTLSVGWPEVGDLTGKSRGDIEGAFYEKWKDAGRTELTQLYNFITIPVGSIVLTPSTKAPVVYIFETTAGYTYVKEQDDDNGDGNPHQLSCKLLETVPSEKFPEDIQRSLKAARRAVTNFTPHSLKIEEFLNDLGVNDEKPTDKYSDAAKDALMSLLGSEDEEIKYKAALALLEKSK